MMAKDDEYLERAYNRLMELSADEQKRLEYEAREKALRDYNTQIKSYWRRGVKEGVDQGTAQEREQGIRILIESLSKVRQPEELICEMVMEQYNLEKEEARRYVEKFFQHFRGDSSISNE